MGGGWGQAGCGGGIAGVGGAGGSNAHNPRSPALSPDLEISSQTQLSPDCPPVESPQTRPQTTLLSPPPTPSLTTGSELFIDGNLQCRDQFCSEWKAR